MNSMLKVIAKSFPLFGLALAFLAPVSGAQAGGYKVVHTFSGQTNGDGEEPWASLIKDGAGNLYGTTLAGGANNWGTVFRIAPDGAESVIYSFCEKKNCSDGQLPHDALIMDKAGKLYGTATYGGDANGQGVVFKLAADGTETVLYSFMGGSGDGKYPYGGLLRDKTGNLYGTTVAGGPDNDGTVFKLAPDGTETVLHSFTNSSSDGNEPMGSLVSDKDGNLYGTTSVGGSDDLGTVFKLAPDGTFTLLHSFTDSSGDGADANPGLIMDGVGDLYGTTWGGGANSRGIAFKLAPDGTETILHSFPDASGDGQNPVGGLVMDKSGNLYGWTFEGGANSDGAVFKLAPDGTETVLHSFCQEQNCEDGAWPDAGAPVLDKAGNLYGTTTNGGEFLDGTIFRLKK
jgi:uncharacterized repeat protein (TIGR03803 family)